MKKNQFIVLIQVCLLILTFSIHKLYGQQSSEAISVELKYLFNSNSIDSIEGIDPLFLGVSIKNNSDTIMSVSNTFIGSGNIRLEYRRDGDEQWNKVNGFSHGYSEIGQIKFYPKEVDSTNIAFMPHSIEKYNNNYKTFNDFEIGDKISIRAVYYSDRHRRKRIESNSIRLYVLPYEKLEDRIAYKYIKSMESPHSVYRVGVYGWPNYSSWDKTMIEPLEYIVKNFSKSKFAYWINYSRFAEKFGKKLHSEYLRLKNGISLDEKFVFDDEEEFRLLRKEIDSSDEEVLKLRLSKIPLELENYERFRLDRIEEVKIEKLFNLNKE
jgi:hypothetical protein